MLLVVGYLYRRASPAPAPASSRILSLVPPGVPVASSICSLPMTSASRHSGKGGSSPLARKRAAVAMKVCAASWRLHGRSRREKLAKSHHKRRVFSRSSHPRARWSTSSAGSGHSSSGLRFVTHVGAAAGAGKVSGTLAALEPDPSSLPFCRATRPRPEPQLLLRVGLPNPA